MKGFLTPEPDRIFDPSSDPAPQGHLLPQGGEGNWEPGTYKMMPSIAGLEFSDTLVCIP